MVGKSAIASCMGPLANPIELSEPAWISLRCDSEAELAWHLAGIMAAVKHHSPAAYAMAGELQKLIRADNPKLQRRLPPRP